MTAGYWLLVALLTTAAVLVAGPLRRSRVRCRALTGPAPRSASTDGPDDPLVDWVAELRRPIAGPAGVARAAGRVPSPPVRQVAGRASLSRPGDAPPLSPRPADEPALPPPAAGGTPMAPRFAGPPRPPGRRDPRRPAGPVGPPRASVGRRPATTGRRPATWAGRVLPDAGRRRVSAVLTASPKRTLLLVGLVGAGLGLLLGGPVAGVALGGYGTLGARALVRRQAARRADRARRRRLDQLCGLAADLRAGLPVLVAAERLGLTVAGGASNAPAPARDGIGLPATNTGPARAPVSAGAGLLATNADRELPSSSIGAVAGGGGAGAGPDRRGEHVPRPPVAPASAEPPRADALPALLTGGPSVVVEPAASAGPRRGEPGRRARPGDEPTGSDRLLRLALAAVRLADRTGAPLAELVERIEADARSTDRGLAAAAAQAAGARATAWLLAALPLGGIGLGYGIGVDPVAVLLHTPVGGGCAVAAIVLQVSGLLWAERLGAAPGRAG